MEKINVLSGISPVEKSPINVQSPAQVADIYTGVVKRFKNRGDVQNGKALAYKSWNATEATFENTPKGIGDGMSTTGWCVSASSALLSDPIFQETIAYRKATAKLISIDIKEQWYGKCYNGSFNKWHTAILVQDNGYNLIVDITCSQFSGDFNEKYVWDFKTWETTFRSAYCKHQIFDAQNNCISPAPASNYVPKKVTNAYMEFARVANSLNDLTNMTATDRNFLAEYFVYNLNVLNDKMMRNDISQLDFDYISKLNKLFEHLPFTTINNGVSVLSFDCAENLKNWVSRFLSDDCKLPQTIFVSKTIEQAAAHAGLNVSDINTKNVNPEKYYIIINYNSIFGINVDFLENVNVLLPIGIQLNVDLDSIRNGGKDIIEANDGGILRKETNAVFMTIR